MKIEVLYFEGCPNHPPTVERVKQVVNRLGIPADVREVELTQDDDPVALKFIGSPTVLINGQDIDPAQREGAGYGFGCRTFGGAGVPPVEMIEQAVREASGAGGSDHDCCLPKTAPQQADSTSNQSNRLSFWSTPGAVGSAILSSACCWLPLLLLAFGLSAGGVAGFFETVRPYFLVAAVVFLGVGFYFAYFRGFGEPACKPGDACAMPNFKFQRVNRAMLWIATVFVIAFALFPYYSPALVRAFAATPADVTTADNGRDSVVTAATRVFHIKGMTCAGCAAALEVELAKLPGVDAAMVSYTDSTATLHASVEKTSDEDVQRAIKRAGFTFRPAPIDP